MNRITGYLSIAALLALASTIVLAANPISIENAWARAVPPNMKNSAAFMLLKNTSDEARAAVSASSNVSDRTELHSHTNDNGVMRMRQVERIDIPAGGSAVLEPGGYHVMLIGLRQPLAPGDEIAIELTFDDGSTERANVPVQKMAGGGHHHHHH